jgi:hypothetical protein
MAELAIFLSLHTQIHHRAFKLFGKLFFSKSKQDLDKKAFLLTYTPCGLQRIVSAVRSWQLLFSLKKCTIYKARPQLFQNIHS